MTSGRCASYHLVHLGASVNADGRTTPGCPGLHKPEHTHAFPRIADGINANTDAEFGIQIDHAGAKAFTRLAWYGIDLPLESSSWPIVSASPQQCVERVSQMVREMTRADMDEVKAQFIASTRSADEYGGSRANRLGHPLEVFKAVRTAWSKDRPMSVRIYAHDGVEGGITPDDAVQYRSAEIQMESNFVSEKAAAAAGKA